MNNNLKTIAAGTGAVIVIAGATIYATLNDMFSPEPPSAGSGQESGPGSGDEVDLGNGPGEPGPGSGDEVYDTEPSGPGSGDEVDLGNGPGEPGPGSGDEVYDTEPSGPGSGDEIDPNQDPPAPSAGSGQETGPGSGDEVDLGNGPGEPGPGSGDEMPADEPTGPGSGDEVTQEFLSGMVKGSCDMIGHGSTCVDYIGSYWLVIKDSIDDCSGIGTWSDKPCPPSSGGCRLNPDSAQEMVTWHYNYGGDPFDAQDMGWAQQACSMSPFGQWVD